MSKLKTLLVDQLQHMLDAETQLTQALPKMAEAAQNPKLQEAFQKHLAQTQQHVERVNEALQALGAKGAAKTCAGMQGLVAEGEEVIAKGKKMSPEIADIALAGAAQKVEHFEIAGYGTLRHIARLINETQVATLLEANLSEEEAADFLLTTISKPLLQEAAMEVYGKPITKQEPVLTTK